MNRRHLKTIAHFAIASGFAVGIFANGGDVFRFAVAAAAEQPPAHDSYWYEKTSFFNTVKTTAAIVMVGDSLTDGAEWGELFPRAGIANRGIDGDTSGGVLERIDGITAVHAGKAFVMLGINDLSDADVAVETVFANYQKIIAALRHSGAAVFVQSTLLCNEELAAWKSCAAVNQKIRQLNEKLAALAPREITFIDLNAKLADAGGLKSELTSDGVHLNGRGYLLWRDAIAPHIVTARKR